MTQRSQSRNRVQRDGTSQSKRRLDALDPASAPVEGRDVGDFLVFAQRFARRVEYFDLTDQKNGDWESFFRCDPSSVFATIEKMNPLPVREAMHAALDEPARPESLQKILIQLANLMRMLDDWRSGVGSATDFREQIERRIRANLPATWQRLVGYHQAIAQRFPNINYAQHVYQGFAGAWWPESLQGEPSMVSADLTVFDAAGTDGGPIENARQHLRLLYAPLYSVLLKIISLATGYFERDLDQRKNVEPHLALFIAFLRLYLQLRDDANNITRWHLEFFYEDVLEIQRRPADADQLHVVVELAKQVKKEHKLASGTLLDAGKDASGVPLQYQVDDDLVANKTQIESFRTVFVVSDRQTGEDPDESGSRIPLRVHAAPVANSQDGLGAEIEDTDRPSWPTLGNKDIPEATIGFAIASRALLLAEGTRTIKLELQADGFPDPTLTLPPDALVAQLSGEKGWIIPDVTKTEVTDLNEIKEGAVTKRSGKLTLQLELRSTAAAVTIADAEVLAESFGTTDPVLKVTLKPKSTAYRFLQPLRLRKVTLATDVVGMTNVIVQNDLFAMDPAKPFEPFGPEASKNSNFYVGCAEAFEKDLTSLTLNITWDSLPDKFSTHYEGYDVKKGKPVRSDFQVEAKFLQDGVWLPQNGTDTSHLFDDVSENDPSQASKRAFSVGNLQNQKPRTIGTLNEWTPAAQYGFVRLKFLSPNHAFFHDKYVSVLTRQSLAAGSMPDCLLGAKYRKYPAIDETLKIKSPNLDADYDVITCGADWSAKLVEVITPNAPYTPTISEFTLDYKASVDTDMPDIRDSLALFHIEPFGYRTASLPQPNSETSEKLKTNPSLLPQFDHEGTLYLGLSNLRPLQSLAILFQVAKATADTDVRKPNVEWSYLTGNKWEAFKEYEITGDTTRGLIASGIVSFSIPRDINTKNTRLPGGLHWLRAAVLDRAQGVSELINAHTQAVRATFVDQGNDANHLLAPLPEETVAGLVADDAKVAGVTQPYDSFGGRPVESGMTFYTRMAEHLRHKGRPITLFDYERLILENFPQIYKTKCINHTNAAHAIAPGHVLIAVIPDFSQLKAVDRREPRVSVDVLDAITRFLASLNCPFVRNDRLDKGLRLHVLNPLFETVRVIFKVRFRPEVTAQAFHVRKLNEAINRLLSPWAFEDSAEISFGGRIYKSTILNFVEEQPYVDVVIDFEMRHQIGKSEFSEDLNAIEATTPRSILVPAVEHGIEALANPQGTMTQALSPSGQIGQMTVSDDSGDGFKIGPADKENQE